MVVLRCLIFGFVFSWVAVSMPLTEMYILTNGPFECFLARDKYFGYETFRSFTEVLPNIAFFNFIIGVAAGCFYKPVFGKIF